MSGTSVDGIDAAIVEISGLELDLQVNLLVGKTYPYPAALRSQILEVCAGQSLSMEQLATLDDAIADQFAQAAIAIQEGYPKADLIASHGQTVYHRPPHPAEPMGYSLQLGRGAAIAQATGISTVSNFRVADLAVGGQGAPLVPRVDAYLLSHPTYHRCIQNVGGISNVAYLPARGDIHSAQQKQEWEQQIRGWDTGPGNVLLDLAVQQLSQGTQTYDKNGAWAATGTPCQALVEQWLQQDFFRQPPPKSTGRELFGPSYLQQCRADADAYGLKDADLLASLTELTAMSIAYNYRAFLPQLPDQVLLCGGGSRNLYLRQRLQAHLDTVSVLTTDEVNVSADFKEAIAFAVLAYWRQQSIPGNLPQVTGARKAMLLGEIHQVG